ncbi:B-cell receptor-associated protein 31-like-domain-containing protein [Dichotomocladium elegans]|nr:B-cell receptor-associated protein 31-like-domain-containing protein [Dichotomocladium elegans]
MTIYYTLTFGILVIEMIIFCILVLPLPSRWRKAMLTFAANSPVATKALHVLKVSFGFIFLLFLDTINRLRRIEEGEGDDNQHHHDYSYEANLKARKFYAQRNLYLTGFTLFLSLILERTSALIIQVIHREEELQNVKNETHAATKSHQEIISKEATYKKEIETLQAELKQLKQQDRDFETLKLQVAQQEKEYQRLADERNALENAQKPVEKRKDI